MNKKYSIIISFFLIFIYIPWTATSQDQANENDVGQKKDAQNSGEAEQDLETDPYSEDSESNASATEVDSKEEEPLNLEEKKNPQLDMSALGEVNPEAELTNEKGVSEAKAKSEVVEKWTERAMDLLELHGYFRVRPELYHRFYIRDDNAVYPRPAERQYNQENDPDGYMGNDCSDEGSDRRRQCRNPSLAGANMRFRLEPVINVSEEVWIKSQIDFLDNVMMGSTPRYWQNYYPYSQDKISLGSVQGWNMGPPDSSQMIAVRRVWGEVMTPFGQLRFGRMGDHFGLGMVHNAGNGIDQDFGDSVDRITFAAKINDWLIAPAFDFPSEGVAGVDASGRPFDVAQLDDAYQLAAIIAYKHDLDDQEAMLKRGDWVVNSGLYFTYRSQVLSFETNSSEDGTDKEGDLHFFRRDMWAITPDFWLQFLLDTFRLEVEVAMAYGEIGNPDRDLEVFLEAEKLMLMQWGALAQIKYGLLSDNLKIGLDFGFASGDKGVEGIRAPATYDQPNAPDSSVFAAFSFNPAYDTDLILYHHVLGSVSQSYYFKLWLDFAFLHNTLGRQMDIGFGALYSRAVEDLSTINNNSKHLGVELDLHALYRTEDHFYAGIKYGVLFPLTAFKGTPAWFDKDETTSPYITDNSLAFPQTLQVILGISF